MSSARPAEAATDAAEEMVEQAKARLRSEMRARRAALEPQVAAEAAAALVRRLALMPVLERAQRIAAYRAVRGEISVDALVDGERWADFTLPRVAGERLEFVARCDGQRFERGAFGISEPLDGEAVTLADHDVVLVPLVAFDASCHRLGQGGGFYDRAMASLAAPGARPRPAFIGIAHWFQQVDGVPRQRWDLPLDAVATDRSVIGGNLINSRSARTSPWT